MGGRECCIPSMRTSPPPQSQQSHHSQEPPGHVLLLWTHPGPRIQHQRHGVTLLHRHRRLFIDQRLHPPLRRLGRRSLPPLLLGPFILVLLLSAAILNPLPLPLFIFVQPARVHHQDL